MDARNIGDTHLFASRCSTTRRFFHQARYGTHCPAFFDYKYPLKFHVTRLNICKIRRRKNAHLLIGLVIVRSKADYRSTWSRITLWQIEILFLVINDNWDMVCAVLQLGRHSLCFGWSEVRELGNGEAGRIELQPGLYTGIYIAENCLRPTGTWRSDVWSISQPGISHVRAWKWIIPIANDCFWFRFPLLLIQFPTSDRGRQLNGTHCTSCRRSVHYYALLVLFLAHVRSCGRQTCKRTRTNRRRYCFRFWPNSASSNVTLNSNWHLLFGWKKRKNQLAPMSIQSVKDWGGRTGNWSAVAGMVQTRTSIVWDGTGQGALLFRYLTEPYGLQYKNMVYN